MMNLTCGYALSRLLLGRIWNLHLGNAESLSGITSVSESPLYPLCHYCRSQSSLSSMA